MANKKIINIGNQSNDGTGDTIRDAFDKVNSNFDDLYNVAGLGDGLRFIKLREAPSVLEANTVLGINTSATKIVQRTLSAGTGMQIVLNDDTITIWNTSSSLSSEINPILGGNLDGLYSHKGIKFAEPFNDYDTVTKKWVYDNFINRDAKYESDDVLQGTPVPVAEGSTLRHNPIALTTATKAGHLVNKLYADTKIASSGTYAIDPATGHINTSMGVMSGPLILFRDPITQDDIDWNGKIAATKSYVDSSSFVSSVNFYVATSGRDNRTDIPSYKKGRALAYAFKTIGKAAEASEQMLAVSQIVLGPYQKTIKTNSGLTDVTIIRNTDSTPVPGATRITVNWSGGSGTGSDAYSDGSLFPGCYILGVNSGAIGIVEKIGYTTSPNEEHYDVVPVDYADTLVSNLTPLPDPVTGQSVTSGNVTLQFATANLVNVPSFWKGYTFTTDNGAVGTIVDTGYYTDPVTANVYDQITVNFTTALPNTNTILGSDWHVYSGFFQLGENLKWGQKQEKTQITILIESGEYYENYPIKVCNNVSIKGDEFRRSIPKPGKFINSDVPTISVSPWVNTYFRRDTQVDGILVAQIDKTTDYSQTNQILKATPNQSENDSVTGVITVTVDAFINDGLGPGGGPSPVSGFAVDPTWKGKVYVGHGGQGEITGVLNNTFFVNLAENSSYQRKLTSTAQLTGGTAGQWHVYRPVNHGYHYLRDSKKPVNYIIQNQDGNYLTSARLLSLNRGFIQAETTAWINAQVAANSGNSGSIWHNFTYDQAKCYRDVGTILDAIVADLDTGGIANSLTAADSYATVSVVKTLQASQTAAAINHIGVLAQRIVQNIPVGDDQGINKYQNTQSQAFDRTSYQTDMAVIKATLGFSLDPSSVTINDGGYGYQYPPTVTFVGGNPTRIARATANVDINGTITSLTFTDNGDGYESNPVILLTPNGRLPATPADISVSVAATGKVKSVSLAQGGRGYYSKPSVTVIGNGNGATVSITVGQVGPYWEVTGATLTAQGSGYSQAYVQVGPTGIATPSGSGSIIPIDNSLASVNKLTTGIASIVNGDVNFNPPLYNDEMDCFLMNDATIIRYISAQGHGGFMKVLDPEGQILAKSPYTQTASSFSRSKNRHVFSGGVFVDGFAGNLEMTTAETTARADVETGTLTQILVNGLKRKPQCPTFFVNNGIRYEVDFVSEYQDDGSGNGTFQALLNLNPAKPGGIYSARISASGFKTSGGGLTVPVRFGSPTISGGIKASGKITIGPSGTLTGTSVNFTDGSPGVGYITTAVNMVVGGAILGLQLNSAGSIDRDNINIINPGSGYASGCVIRFDTGPSATAVGSISSVDSSGGITGITFSNTGSGYSTPPSYWFGTNYDQSIEIKAGYIGTLPSQIECITAGNRSMLANDFTQMNDLGYGIFVTNGGFMENVSMFTYYCYSSYYALNGAQVRSITGSSAYGGYGLIAEGSDPLEVPITMSNADDTEQIIQFKNWSGYTNVKGATTVYAQVLGFEPYGLSEVEVNHYGNRVTYTIVSATKITDDGAPSNFYLLSLNTNGSTWYQTMAANEVLNGTFRVKYQQKFNGFNPSVLTRASVVYNYGEDPQTTYKVSNTAYQGNDITIITSTVPYNYVSIQPWVESTYRQGVYSVTQTGGTGYSPNATVNVTFRTPDTVTASNALASDQDSLLTTSTVMLTGGGGKSIHVGMIASSADGVINNNVVTWVNTGTSNPTMIGLQTPIKGLTASTVITFTGKPAKGVATANASGVISANNMVITDSGVGYTSDNAGTNGPLSSAPTISPSPSGGGATPITITNARIAGLQNGTTVKINQLNTLDSARVLSGLAASTPYYYIFGYEGFLFKITAYRPPVTTGQPWAEIDVQRVNQNGVNITPNGLPSEMMANNLYAGLQKSQNAYLTQRISTLRATSHDLVDVGTGGYADSKIPNDLYGPPRNSPYKDINIEVRELNKGRVFFVTTDQDGTFNVGYLLEVRQSDGTINLNAPVALSNLPSIKLQKGQLIDNFSADPSMTGESNSTVPTERAIVQFVERRLGTSKSGFGTTLGLIGNGYIDRAGVQGMTGPLNMNGRDTNIAAYNQPIQNLKNPANNNDAVNRIYVDSLRGEGTIARKGTLSQYNNGASTEDHPEWGQMTGPLWAHADPVAGDPALQVPTKRWVDNYRQISTLSDVTFTSPADVDLVGFSASILSVNTTTARPIWNQTRQVINLANDVRLPVNTPTSNMNGIGGTVVGSDVSFTRTANTLTIKLVGSAAGDANELYNPITDYHVNKGAQIRQYKLLMTQASTTATAPAGSQQQIQNWLGLSAYDPTMFTVTNGWVTLGDSTTPSNGILLSKLQKIPANTDASGNKGGLLGSISVNASSVSVLNSATVVTFLEAITKDGRQTLTGSLTPAFTSSDPRNVNLGSNSLRYNTVYADTFNGTATKAVSLLSSLAAQTYVQATTSTANASIVQRDATGYINGTFIIDPGTASFLPSADSDVAGFTDLGNGSQRFNNVYIKTLTPGTRTGNIANTWVMTAASGHPELIGPDDGSGDVGANLGRPKSTSGGGRFSNVYTRAIAADDARTLGMTVTNNIAVGSNITLSGSSGRITAQSMTLGTALGVAYGGTGAQDAQTALLNLLPAATTVGNVLTYGGGSNFYWGAGGGGGGSSGPSGSLIASTHYTFTAPGGPSGNDFTFPTFGYTYLTNQGQLRVYVNGVRQISGTDFSETEGGNGSTVKAQFRMLYDLDANDVVYAEIDGYTIYQFTAGNTFYNVSGSVPAGSNPPYAAGQTSVQAALDYIENDKIRKIGGTLTSGGSGGLGLTMGPSTTLNLAAGTTTKVPMKFASGTILPNGSVVAGALEWDGQYLWITQDAGPTRVTIADQSWVGNQGFITLNSLSMDTAGTASGSGSVTYSSSTGKFKYTPPDLSTYATQSYVTTRGYLTSTGTIDNATTAATANGLNTSNGYQVANLGVGKAAPGGNDLAVKGAITAEGDVTAYYTSDINLKTKIESITGALGKVTMLSGVTFNWNEKAQGKDQTRREAGVIAQQIQEVLPEAVAERDNGTLAVRYEQLVPLLIEAIKELKAEVDLLKKAGE